ncbi:Na+/H+ antiporter [Chitinophaga agrisoli]|uniref:Na+/H+ antiporter n=1 Tax=Chitinophaga agrisoli TaxID=2607653 RepID=A0A5B2VGE8_9BACT|nr:Na+/H+ antiporter [Chitinophaga agrisoli]KAA2238633.1 Na+/H+ antiporter [Chitinophaga agrisoli]
MLEANLLIILSLLFVTSMLALLSQRLKISYPILLVLAGLLISFIPKAPVIKMDPDIIFIIFLPPLLYASAWNTSWGDFWRLRRPIGLLSFGLVILTATAVAFFSHWLIPDFSLALGFLLGGIISPPDAVAAASVFQSLKVPKQVVSILEGESLVNDASSLIVFRFALAAIFTGQFVFSEAVGSFFTVVIFGVLIGLAIAHIVYAIHRFLPTTPSIDTALTLISPYLMYLTAEHFHCSGVLAVVSGGLFLSFRSSDIFSYNSRLQANTVWNVLAYLLNGIVFILIGLQLPDIIQGIGEYSLKDCIFFAVAISLLTIVIRILWVFMAAYLPILRSKTIGRPDWKSVFIVGWSGMRGVVSLASALAVPLTLVDGSAFPQRSLVLFITFVVILVTLILQGLSLPVILRFMKLEVEEEGPEQEQEITHRLAEAVIAHLDTHCQQEVMENPVFRRTRERFERIAEAAGNGLMSADATPALMKTHQEMLLEIIAVRRAELKHMHRRQEFTVELIRAKERELDMEEASIRES